MEFKFRKSLVKCPHVLVIKLTIVALPRQPSVSKWLDHSSPHSEIHTDFLSLTKHELRPKCIIMLCCPENYNSAYLYAIYISEYGEDYRGGSRSSRSSPYKT